MPSTRKKTARKAAGTTRATKAERVRWHDGERPVIEEQIHRLAGYLDALGDGVVDERELFQQARRAVAAMQALEPELDDALHARVTAVLLELTAYNVMRILRVLEQRRSARTRGRQ
jgi:hypothetical protein